VKPAYDIAIVGGGMVGASLAVAVAPLGLRVALIEALPYDDENQPSFDERTTALSNASRRIFDTLGLWQAIEADATAIQKIHVSEQGRFGFARIDAGEQKLDALGYVVPNRVLGRALWMRLAQNPQIEVICPARVMNISAGPSQVELQVRTSTGITALATRLIVAADGAHSSIRVALGVDASVDDYGQVALVATVLPERFHHHVAYERFTPAGPLALLPLSEGRCALILTLAADKAPAAKSWSDAQFLDEIQQRFGFRLGRFLKAGPRFAYPLALTRSARTTAARCAIVGNAAQGLHPVAGMGFNLGLRDIACLAELIARFAHDGEADLGNPALLREYEQWRASDRRGIIAFTDALVRLFANPLPMVGRVRRFGLLAFDLLPPAKRALSALSTGKHFAASGELAARIPKLARGVPLTRGGSR
jgi:2-octaprenyl-6-methoxyphenol hydroxylase